MKPDRRRFERFSMVEDAIALTDDGRILGHVTQASGGGMLIRLDDPTLKFATGQYLRITIVEPGPGARHTMDAMVRYRHEDSIGVEFISGNSR